MTDEKRDPPWQEQLLQALSQPPPSPREPSEQERQKMRAECERIARLAREKLNAKRASYRAHRREKWQALLAAREERLRDWRAEKRRRAAERQNAERQTAEQIRAEQIEAARKMMLEDDVES